MGGRWNKAMVIAGTTVGVLGLGVGIAVASGPATPARHGPSAPAPTPDPASAPVADKVVATPFAPATTVPPVADPPTAPPTTVRAPALPRTTVPPATGAPASATRSSGSDGSLSATLTATPAVSGAGAPISIVLSVSDTAATGPVGPMSLTYGDGQPAPETGLAAQCHAGSAPDAVNQSFAYSHAYSGPGTYTVTATVASPCSAEQVTLSLSVTVTGA